MMAAWGYVAIAAFVVGFILIIANVPQPVKLAGYMLNGAAYGILFTKLVL